MQFGNPAALWLLLLLPLLLWRRALPQSRRAVAAMHLWTRAAAADTASRPRTITVDPLVLLRAGILTALVVALAGPAVHVPGQRVAVVVDVSASMGAREASGTRLDAARRRVRSIVESLPWFTRVVLMAASETPSVLGEFGSTDPALRSALDELRPSMATADVGAAVERARSSGVDRAYVVTDRAAAPHDRRHVSWITVGAPADNAAVTMLDARESPGTPGATQAVAAIHNYGATAITRQLTFTADNRILLRTGIDIPPGSYRTVPVVTATPSGPLVAAIDGVDALRADDSRSVSVRPFQARRIRIDRATPFLAAAVAALPGVVIVTDRPDVVVCGACASAPGDAAAVLWLPDSTATAAPAPLRRTAATHPVASSLSLEGASVAPIPGAVGDATVLATAGDVPAVLASETVSRRVVELRMDLSRGSLPLTPAFPVLIANAIDWLASMTLDGQLSTGIPAAESDLRAAADAPARSDAGTPDAAEAPAADLSRWLLAAAALLLAIEWWYRFRRAGRRPQWRSAATAIRAAAVALLVLAVAGLKLPWGAAPVSAFVLIDRSASMGAEGPALARLASIAHGIGEDDRIGVIAFGARASIERRLGAAPTLPAVASTVDRGATDIEAALRLGRTTLPWEGARRLVVVTDGQQTTGDALREARLAALEGIRIDVAEPAWLAASPRPAMVTRVAAPASVATGEPFDLAAAVEGMPGSAIDVIFERENGRPVVTSVTIPASGQTTAVLRDRQVAAGEYVYRARVALPADDFTADEDDDASTGAVVLVSGQPRVLHVGDSPQLWRAALAGSGFQVDAAAPDALPRTASALEEYDAIVIDDLPGDRLDDAQSRAIAEYVEQRGGGVLIAGGAGSLGPGLAGNTALAALSPVDFRPRAGQRAPEAALVIAFDKSGSMADLVGGAPKIEYARQAVERVLETLSAADRVGVIAFDAAPVAVLPLEAGQALAAVKTRLRDVTASGATAVAPALELASSWLRSAPGPASTRRHILLVSDGRTSPADAARSLASAVDGGIRISVVAPDAAGNHEFLEALTSRTGGRAYFPEDTRELPRLLAREASRAVGERIVEEPFRIRVAPHPVTAGVDMGALPALNGYVVGSASAPSETPIVSHLGDPILAAARRGLGRVAVYTAGLQSGWSDDLRRWQGFAGMLTQTVRWISRRSQSRTLHATFQPTASGVHVTVEASSFATPAEQGGEVTLDIRRPGSGSIESIALQPTAAGRYEAHVEAATSGGYVFAMTARSATSEERVVRGFYHAAQPERLSTGIDRALLTAMARTTGGVVLGAADSVFAAGREQTWRPVLRWLAAGALALFLVEQFAPALASLRRRVAALRARLTPSEDAV